MKFVNVLRVSVQYAGTSACPQIFPAIEKLIFGAFYKVCCVNKKSLQAKKAISMRKIFIGPSDWFVPHHGPVCGALLTHQVVTKRLKTS